MAFILGLIICFTIFFLAFFIGHLIVEITKAQEKENKSLNCLLKMGVGFGTLILIINLFGLITKSLNISLLITLFLTALFALLQYKKKVFDSKFFNELVSDVKGYCLNFDKYLVILLGVINFVYGVSIFSKISNNEFLSAKQFLEDIYLPRFASFHSYSADMLGAVISKFSGLNFELSFDILALVFINLSLLSLYILGAKFLNSTFTNKYIVIIMAFFAWGPITSLFKSNALPNGIFEKVIYLTTNNLLDPAKWSGPVIYWLLEPSNCIGIFIGLITIFLLFEFLNNENNNLRSGILISILMSSLLITNLNLFLLIFISIFLFFFFVIPLPYTESNNTKANTKWKNLLIRLSTIFFLPAFTIFTSFIFNPHNINNINLLNLGVSSLEFKHSPFNSNFVLLIVYLFGFYKAFQLRDKWVFFLSYFFATGLLVPLFITLDNFSINSYFMTSNFLGAFSLPIAMNYIAEKLNFKGKKIFYLIFILIFCICSMMLWGFGDFGKQIFIVENGSLKYTGLQKLPLIEERKYIAAEAIKYLHSRKIKGETIITDPELLKEFYYYTALNTIITPQNIRVQDTLDLKYRTTFSFNSKYWMDNKIKWVYITPKLFHYFIPPQGKIKLLNSNLMQGLKLTASNNKDLIEVSELYEINPKTLLNKVKSTEPIENLPVYIKQISDCPFYGIYNAKSNDFDGDKIADVAFFDEIKRKWYIIHGKDQKESVIDLNDSLLLNQKVSDLLIPIPSDYDGDLKTDIALFNRTEGSWHVLRSSDSLKDENIERLIWSKPAGEIPLPADIDGDSKTDIACFDAMKEGSWHNHSSITNEYVYHNFGFLPTDIPLRADIDGDSKADYVIYKTRNEEYEVYLSSENFNTTPIKVKIGNSLSRAVPADYDGDGKFDLATWTPVSGKWEIAFAKDFLSQSKTNAQNQFIGCGIQIEPNSICNINIKVKELGSPGNIPMPGDYDGNGTDDIAVYDKGSGILKILYIDQIRTINLLKYKNYLPASFIGI